MIIKFKIQETEYSADLDGNCYILSRHGINQADGANKGNPTVVQLGYFSQIKSAVSKAIKDQMGQQPDEVTLKEFLDRYEKSTQDVMNQIGEK